MPRPRTKATCPHCGRVIRLNRLGLFRFHNKQENPHDGTHYQGVRCRGVGRNVEGKFPGRARAALIAGFLIAIAAPAYADSLDWHIHQSNLEDRIRTDMEVQRLDLETTIVLQRAEQDRHNRAIQSQIDDLRQPESSPPPYVPYWSTRKW